MKFKKFLDDNQQSLYMCNRSIYEELIEATIIQDNKCFILKVSKEDKSVKNWTKRRKISAETYLKEFNSALNEDISEKTLNSFIVQDDESLVWKQYFENKKIYGNLGSFPLAKVDYETGTKQCFETIFEDNNSLLNENRKLKLQVEKYKKDYEEALLLTEKSVAIKENFERQIYGKFVALLNAKTNKVNELAEMVSCTKMDNSEVSGVIPSTSKAKNYDSDEIFDAATDVDEPDQESENSDEEKNIIKVKKQNQEVTAEVSKRKDFESKDDLFNMSLEAELNASLKSSYTETRAVKKPKSDKQIKRSIGGSLQDIDSNNSIYDDSSLNNTTLSSGDNSILKQFFNC